jgi:NTE family protein
MQIGALRALFEAGYKPDLLVGTSIGAVNATGLALWGANLGGVVALEWAYQDLAEANLMDARLGRLALRTLSGRPNQQASQRVKELFIAAGITPGLCFDRFKNVRVALISADLDLGKTVIFGQDPNQSVLDGLMASISLPPWFAPVEKDGQYIVDGGTLSNLPIEPALRLGATEIISLDLSDLAPLPGNDHGINHYMSKLVFSVTQRQIFLETALAEAHGVPVRNMVLRSSLPVPMWDFHKFRELIEIGYEIASHEIDCWEKNSWAESTLPGLILEHQPCWESA